MVTTIRRVMLVRFMVLLCLAISTDLLAEEQAGREPTPSRDQGYSAPFTPLQLAIMGESKLFTTTTPVYGLGLGLVGVHQGPTVGLVLAPIYTSTERQYLTIQLAPIFNNVRSSSHGTLQLSGWNTVDGHASGLMAGVLNTVNRSYTGLQLGVVNSFARGGVLGLQLAGVMATTDAQSLGVQLAGFRTENNNSSWGIQIAGSNVQSHMHFTGIQLAGFSSSTGRNMRGGQFGLFATSTDLLSGIQLGGLYNNNAQMKGLQATLGINEAASSSRNNSTGVMLAGLQNSSRTTLTGAQVASYNKARELKGIQFGLVNRSTRLNGIQIGLINFHRGRLAMPLVNLGWSIGDEIPDEDEESESP